MTARVTALLTALLALGSFGMAARSRPAPADAAALASTGSVQVANSKNGKAILSGTLGPNTSVSGTVTISNVGSAAGAFSLSLSHLADTPGPGGGFFSRQLALAVDDVTKAAAPVAVYHGPLNSLNPTALGTYAAGQAHTYQFVVSWPPSAIDSTMYGSSMSVEFDWSASDVPVTPPPATTPAPPPPGLPATPAAPRLTLGVSSRQRVLKAGAVQASVACDEACTVVGTGSLSVPNAAKVYRLVTARKRAKPGTKVRLKLKLPRRARGPLRAALRAHRKPVVRIVIGATNAGGQTRKVKRTIRVVG